MTTDPVPPSEDSPPPIRKFLGSVAMALGALVIGLCGLCSAKFLGPSLWGVIKGGGGNAGGFVFVLVIALIIDAIPVAIGIVIFRAGLRIYRE